MRPSGRRGAAALLICLIAAAACSAGGDASSVADPSRGTEPPPARTTEAPTRSPSATASPAPPPVVVAAGDIATCEADTDEATAALVAEVVEELDAEVLTLGDHAYPNGTTEQFERCYGDSWGRFADRTHPVLGNHDYHTALGAPYFDYFGAAAGAQGEGWYSFEVGEWHVVALNSNCELVGCDPESLQGRWLVQDLATSGATCTLALFHHPRWSSGPEGDQVKVAELWRMLVEGGVDVALSGHAHQYERLAPVDATGARDPERGVRQFVVGTGGRSLYEFGAINAASEMRWNGSFGVLKLALRPAGYDWEFVPVDVAGFTDTGSGACH